MRYGVRVMVWFCSTVSQFYLHSGYDSRLWGLRRFSGLVHFHTWLRTRHRTGPNVVPMESPYAISWILPHCMECRRGLAMRILSTSLHLSNAWIVKKQKKILFRFLYHMKDHFSLVFWEKAWLVGATHSTWNFVSNDPSWSEIANFEAIFTRSASAVKT